MVHTPPKSSGRGQRDLRVKVKTARKRRLSSTRWLERQLNDPYVKAAKDQSYRGRAAFKLAELDDRFGFLYPGARVIDLGAAPGGWCQVACARVNAYPAQPNKPQGMVLGVDLKEVEPISGVRLIKQDFMEDNACARIKSCLNGAANVVMSDMASPSSGHKKTDHLRIIMLAEAAAFFAFDVLAPEGVFLTKVLAGGTESSLLALLKRNFVKTNHVKPPASRSDSTEKYLIASGFRGDKKLN